MTFVLGETGYFKARIIFASLAVKDTIAVRKCSLKYKKMIRIEDWRSKLK